MPAAGDETPEDGLPSSPRVDVERLRIELTGEFDYLLGGDQARPQMFHTPDHQVLPEEVDLGTPGGQLGRGLLGGNGHLLVLLLRSCSAMLRCPHPAPLRSGR